jgi:phenylpropionate dioxygenase-like ring-hydroxylating dioxygenase large terminal subunit
VIPPELTPPTTRPHTSVVGLSRYWYVACSASALGSQPLARTVLGIPMVLFRDSAGRAHAFLDRCPHRNVPLSMGRVTEEGTLRCAYHGWEFEGSGARCRVPSLCGEDVARAGDAETYPVCEQDEFIWVFPSREEVAPGHPDKLRLVNAPGYTTIRRELTFEASVHATVENALDVPHTRFLHGGLFRSAGEQENEIEICVRRDARGVEAEYLGEPRPSGWVGRLLAPRGGVVQHFDRFLLPSVAQVEYALGERSHLLVTSLCTPVTDFETRMHAVISFRLPLPGWLVALFLEPIAMRILRQDQEIVRAQTEVITRFGGERYASTEVDVLGGDIHRLMKQAAAGETEDPRDPPVERRVRMRT